MWGGTSNSSSQPRGGRFARFINRWKGLGWLQIAFNEHHMDIREFEGIRGVCWRVEAHYGVWKARGKGTTLGPTRGTRKYQVYGVDAIVWVKSTILTKQFLFWGLIENPA